VQHGSRFLGRHEASEAEVSEIAVGANTFSGRQSLTLWRGVTPSTPWVFWSLDVINDEVDKLDLDRLEM